MSEDTGMNKTAGRSGPFEPMPQSVEMVWCKLKEQRVDTNEARASYQDHQDTCIDCRQCQFFE